MFIFPACDFRAMFRDIKTDARQPQVAPRHRSKLEAMANANYIVICDFVSRKSQVSGTNNLR